MIPKRNLFLLFKRVTYTVIFLITCAAVFFTARYFIHPAVHTDRSIPADSDIALERNVSSRSDFERAVDSVKVPNSELHSTREPVNHRVHVFYYPWYGNPDEDSEYLHWNHEYLPNWDKQDIRQYPTGKHEPPDDIGSNFYPQLGCYSSRSPSTVAQHMEWIKSAGIGVLVVSWYPPDQADKEGKPFDQIFPLILDTASRYGLKVAFHIEPYEGRNPLDFKEKVDYIIQKYGNHPSTYKLAKSAASKPLPVFYVYDSYLNSPTSWSTLLKRGGKYSIRNTELDGIFLGLVVELRHKQDMVIGGFDGFYTYFAANDFTYGSSWKNWKSLSSFARKNGLLFVPSVGPGYVDTRVRPWNGKTTRQRRRGKYFRIGWKSALQTRPALISITSFNEWHEGTQIEPAVPRSHGDYVYDDYQPDGPDFYLNLTRDLASEYAAVVTFESSNRDGDKNDIST